jgi:hypothetical protein
MKGFLKPQTLNYLTNSQAVFSLKKGKKICQAKDKQFVRLDTLGNNTKLMEHYTKAGFDFLGIFKLTDTKSLLIHYQNEPNCCPLKIELATSKNS